MCGHSATSTACAGPSSCRCAPDPRSLASSRAAACRPPVPPRVRRMRRSRVFSCLASSTQQMNSLRAKRSDVLPRIERRAVGDQRLAQIGRKLVHDPTGHSLVAHSTTVAGRKTYSAPRPRRNVAIVSYSLRATGQPRASTNEVTVHAAARGRVEHLVNELLLAPRTGASSHSPRRADSRGKLSSLAFLRRLSRWPR